MASSGMGRCGGGAPRATKAASACVSPPSPPSPPAPSASSTGIIAASAASASRSPCAANHARHAPRAAALSAAARASSDDSKLGRLDLGAGGGGAAVSASAAPTAAAPPAAAAVGSAVAEGVAFETRALRSMPSALSSAAEPCLRRRPPSRTSTESKASMNARWCVAMSSVLRHAAVDGGERVVEHHERRARVAAACHGEALLLPARERHAALTHHRGVAVRELRQVREQRAAVQHARVAPRVEGRTEEDVVAHRAVANVGVLRRVGHRFARRYRHALHLPQLAAQRQQQRGLAAAHRAHHRHHLAAADGDADVPEGHAAAQGRRAVGLARRGGGGGRGGIGRSG
eukprot:scaffold23081_cov61-Phaeocystis_antarctica.AAC.8